MDQGARWLRGRGMLSAGAVIACVVAVAASMARPALARPRHHKRVGACNVHRHHATKVTSRIIVYAKNSGLDQYDVPLTTYYVCLRPAGKSVAVGHAALGGGEYPGNEAVSYFRIAGTYVADISAAGYASAAACSKYEGPDDPVCDQQVTWWIEAVDAKTRRGARVDLPGGIAGGATTLVVSSAGALAWLQPTTTSSGETLAAMALHHGVPGQLTGAVQTLDSGAIGSLQFQGLTLSWSNAGVTKTVTLY